MKSMLKSLMSVAVAALAFTSCSNDATEDVMPNVGTKTLVVNASIDQTRTVMAENHVNLEWTDDDVIYLYIGETATASNEIRPKTGGTINDVTYKEGDNVYAYYSLPYDGEESTGAKNALININQTQTQTDASIFAGKNLPMVAKGKIESGKVTLNFQPVGCVLVFNVYGQGTTAGEKVKSIKFETSKGCYGYDYCDLTADKFKYEAYSDGKNATVTLTNPATIGASKPSDTKVGENQIYLVVAQAEYPAGSKFTVTTDVNNAYTFTTTTALDCSKVTARVVNLNLAKSPEGKPAIEVPTDPIENSSSEQTNLFISGIQFKNIADKSNVEVGAFSDAELKTPLANPWITFADNAELSEGTIRYNLAANDGTERTAYIGIKCGDAQASIAVTQLAKGKFVTTYVPANMGYENDKAVPSPASLDNGNVTLTFDKGEHPSGLSPKYTDNKVVRCYKENTVTVAATQASKILKIEIVRDGAGSSKLSVNGSFLPNNNNTFTWTGVSEPVVLTVKDDTFKLMSMKIYYGEDNEPRIEAPTTVEKRPAEKSTLTIQDIVFKNFAADQVAQATAGIFSNAGLTEQENVDWLTIDANATDLSSGKVVCNVAENTAAAERTAYIGIKCGTEQAAIAVTQSGKIAPPAPGTILFEEHFEGFVTNNNSEWTDYKPKFSDATKLYKNDGSIKLGSSKFIGSITTQELNLLAPVTLEFKVKEYKGNAGNIDISVSNGTAAPITKKVSYSAGTDFQSVSVSLDAATSTSTITIATTSGNKRAYIDDIIVKVTEQ